MERKLLSGNEAVAWGAWEAGVRFASAYPGTPSTEILETLSRFPEVKAEWSTNEKVAYEAALGAAIGGARALVAMKHVGLNVAADPFFTSAYTGVNGGLVVVSADDPGMHSSQNEQDNRHYARAAKVPLLEPSSQQEAYEFARLAFELSERFDIPVLLRLTTRIAHTKGVVKVSGERQSVPLRPYQKNPAKYVMVPAHARKRHQDLEERIERLRTFAEESALNRIEPGIPEIGIVASGVAYTYAKEVFPDATFLKLGMPWPFPRKLAFRFAAQVQRIVVVEELEPFLESELALLGIRADDHMPRVGELTPSRVRKALTGRELPHPAPQKSVARPPALCPGCPHAGVFFTLHRLRATVMGDIGCYTLGVLPPYQAMDTTVDMGASIGMLHGLLQAREEEAPARAVAVIGDSTFLHSGVAPLMDLFYNRGTGTVVILDNRTTAMTGHQPHPGTGRTARGEPGRRVDLEALVRGIGIREVHRVDPHDLKATRLAIQRAMESPEPAVVIAERPCVLLPEERKKAATRPKRSVNPEQCLGERCRVCLQVGCPAIHWEEGHSAIDPLLCVGCDLCVQVCPTGAIA